MPEWEYLQATARWDSTGWLWVDSAGLDGHCSAAPDQAGEPVARGIDDPDHPMLLNRFGGQGWELTQILVGHDGATDFIFKRPREEVDEV